MRYNQTTEKYNMQFPIDLDVRPAGYAPLPAEPGFVAGKHLALERPAGGAESLTDFGYTAAEVAQCPSDFAVSGVFRMLSAEGAACLYEVCKMLETFAAANPRIARCVRGGVYRSKFLRDLCLSPEVAEFASELCGAKLSPHTIPHQLGHLNYAPKEIGGNVDKWHTDTLRFDYVMFVTDPAKNRGGAFQYFRGTKKEMAAYKARGEALPPGKIVAPKIPAAGFAVMQQGNMVVHQARGLEAPGERITMVNGYILQDPSFADFTRYDQLLFADPPHVVTAEFGRHIALQGRRLLAKDFIDDGDGFSPDRENIAARLDNAAAMLQDAAAQIRRADSATMEHFGD